MRPFTTHPNYQSFVSYKTTHLSTYHIPNLALWFNSVLWFSIFRSCGQIFGPVVLFIRSSEIGQRTQLLKLPIMNEFFWVLMIILSVINAKPQVLLGSWITKIMNLFFYFFLNGKILKLYITLYIIRKMVRVSKSECLIDPLQQLLSTKIYLFKFS